MSDPLFECVAIVGLGLIGSSLAYDLRERKLAKHIIGVDSNPLCGELLRERGVVDEVFASSSELTTTPDLVVIATSPRSFEPVAANVKDIVGSESIVIDTGSIKQFAVDAIAPHLLGKAIYIPTHPITGSELSGAHAGQAGLFEHRRVILTPIVGTPEEAVQKVIDLWEALGAVCDGMDAETHDLIYAHVSHLPHLAAYAATETLAHYVKTPTDELTDFIRIGGSNPQLWVDITRANRTHMLTALEHFLTVLVHIIAELKSGEDEETNETCETSEVAAALFPRLVASCLISAVTLCEKREQLSLARYAGRGFTDMASPVQIPPDDDIERISNAYRQVVEVLSDFEQRFRSLFIHVSQEDWDALLDEMTHAQQTYQHFTGKKTAH